MMWSLVKFIYTFFVWHCVTQKERRKVVGKNMVRINWQYQKIRQWCVKKYRLWIINWNYIFIIKPISSKGRRKILINFCLKSSQLMPHESDWNGIYTISHNNLSDGKIFISNIDDFFLPLHMFGMCWKFPKNQPIRSLFNSCLCSSRVNVWPSLKVNTSNDRCLNNQSSLSRSFHETFTN